MLDRGDLHGRQRLQARDRFVDHVEALAEREPHERAAGVVVVVEDDVGHGDHAAALGQRAAEREAVVLAERADVGGDEVGAGRREHGEAGVGEPSRQPIAFLAQLGGERRENVSSRGPGPTAIACWNGPPFT